MKRIEILDVLPGETEEQAAERMKPAPEMGRDEYFMGLSALVGGIALLPPGVPVPDRLRDRLEHYLCDYSITRDLIPLLRTPPQVCPRCGKPFRSLDVPQPMCRDCRNAAEREAEIEAEVKARLAKYGET